MFESVKSLVAEYLDLQNRLSDSAVHADAKLARKLGRRYAQLGGIVELYNKFVSLENDIFTAKELAVEDSSFVAEVVELEKELGLVKHKLRSLLIPRDPDDIRNVILEVKAGEGGDESALFAGDLLRMYLRFCERMGWKSEIISATESDLGGYKDVQVAVKYNTNNPAEGVWAQLKFEGGVHRVQRVPVTESQGRIHTSAAAVVVLPEVDEPDEVQISSNDLKIDVYRSSGPGGQSVNTTDSAVRITHLPTGIVVAMQNEKSQLQNREAAMRVLRARILAAQKEEKMLANSQARRSQVRTADRSERIRTYNFPENRINDHRTGYKSYNLDQVMGGDLIAVIQSAIDMDETSRLAALGEDS